MTFLLRLWSFKELIAVGLIALGLALGAVYLKGRSDESTSYKAKEAQQTVKDIKKARNIENETQKLSPSDIDRGLDKWMRD